MRKIANSASWVVYLMTMRGKPSGLAAVCERSEWDAMERAQPGHHTLIRSDIASEGEAEQLARSQPAPDCSEPKPLARVGMETIQSEPEISVA